MQSEHPPIYIITLVPRVSTLLIIFLLYAKGLISQMDICPHKPLSGLDFSDRRLNSFFLFPFRFLSCSQVYSRITPSLCA